MEISDLARSMLDAFDNSNEGLAIWSKDDKLVGFNKKYSKIFKRNMSIEAKVGLEFISSYKTALKIPGSILNKKDIEERLSLREKARKDKKPIIREFLLDGIWFKIKETPSNDGVIITLITDITENKKNSEMQERLSDAIESIPSHVMFWDKEEKLIKANSLAINENSDDGVKLKEGMHYSDFLKSQFKKNLYNVPKDFDLESFVKKRIQERAALDSKSSKVKYKNGRTVIRTENKLADGGILTILNDVTELEEKESSERLLATSLDNMSYGFALWDKNQKLIRFNKALIAVNERFGIKTELGISFKESLENQVNNDFYDISKSEKKDWVKKGIEYFTELKGERTTTYRHPDGRFSMVTDRRLDDGTTLQIVSDVTYLKEQEKELRRLSEAIDTMSIGVILWGSDHNLIFANQRMREIQKSWGFEFVPGVSRSDMLSNQVKKGVSPLKDGMTVEGWIKDSVRQMKESKDGIKLDMNIGDEHTIVSAQLLEDGSYIQSYTDITELKNKEIELTRFQEGIENMDMGMAFWDKTDHLIYANKGLRDFNKDIGFDMHPGVSRIEMLSNQIEKNAMDYGTGSAKKVHKDFMVKIDEAAKKGAGASIEFATEINKEQVYMMVTGFRMKSGDWIQTVSNVTELKKREDELKRIYDGIDVMNNATILWDSNDRVAFCNKEAIEVQKEFGFIMGVGTRRVELIKNAIKNGFLNLPDNQTIEQYIENSKKVLKDSGAGMTIEVGRWILNTVGLEDGSYIQSYTDISEIKEKQSQLERLSDAIDTMPSGVIIWDRDQKLFFANEYARNVQKEIGFELKTGASRKDMLQNSINKGVFPLYFFIFFTCVGIIIFIKFCVFL